MYFEDDFELDSSSHVEKIFNGTTFDDFTLQPQYGQLLTRKDAVLETNFSRHIQLKLPVVAANMDTITGPEMCVAMAQEGGMGILPRSDSISIDTEVGWVNQVKRAESFIIFEPFCIYDYQTIREARQKMAEVRKETLLVLGTQDQLVAVLRTAGNMRFCEAENNGDQVKQWMDPLERNDYSMAKVPKTIQQAKALVMKHHRQKLVFVDEDFKLKALVTSKDILNLLHHQNANKDGKGRLRVGAAIGAKGDYLERAAELIKAGVDAIVIDIAHGHSERGKNAILEFRKRFGPMELVCGNVASFASTEFLRELDVDAIKVGIGPGRGCRTRLETGIGVSQMHAIRFVWHGAGDIPFIADGGVSEVCDIAKAIAGGASSVMLGSFFAGTEETPGPVITKHETGRRIKKFGGMTRQEAKLKDAGSSEEVRHIEGQEYEVEVRCSVKDILNRIRHGLQSMVSYSGELTLESARQKMATEPWNYFIRQSPASQRESNDR